MRQTSTGSGPAKVEDLPSPALIVDLDAFERNVAAAADLVRGSGTNLRPHVKTHRTPGRGRSRGHGRGGDRRRVPGERDRVAGQGGPASPTGPRRPGGGRRRLAVRG